MNNFDDEDLLGVGKVDLEAPAEEETSQPDTDDTSEAAEETTEQASEETSEQEQEASGEEKQEPDMVPHGKFHNERVRRQEAEERANTLTTQLAKGNERLQMLMERMTQPQQPQQQPQQEPEDPMPDRYEDPDAYEAWQQRRIDRIEGKIATYERNETQKAEHAQQVNEVQQYTNEVVTRYKQDAVEYNKAHPEFEDAHKFVVETQARFAAASGHPNPAQYQQETEFSIVNTALRSGVSPAEAIMNVAEQLGWKKQENSGNSEAEDKLDKIDKGQQASRKVSGSATPKGKPTLEMLGSMSDAEWQAWYEKAGEEGLYFGPN